jgi:hypothetical protein
MKPLPMPRVHQSFNVDIDEDEEIKYPVTFAAFLIINEARIILRPNVAYPFLFTNFLADALSKCY